MASTLQLEELFSFCKKYQIKSVNELLDVLMFGEKEDYLTVSKVGNTLVIDDEGQQAKKFYTWKNELFTNGVFQQLLYRYLEELKSKEEA